MSSGGGVGVRACVRVCDGAVAGLEFRIRRMQNGIAFFGRI